MIGYYFIAFAVGVLAMTLGSWNKWDELIPVSEAVTKSALTIAIVLFLHFILAD